LAVVLLALLVPYPTLAQETGHPHEINPAELRANLDELPGYSMHILGNDRDEIDFYLDYVQSPPSVTIRISLSNGELVFYLDEDSETVSFDGDGPFACPGTDPLISRGCELGEAAAILVADQLEAAYEAGTAVWDSERRVFKNGSHAYNVEFPVTLPISIQSETCTIVFRFPDRETEIADISEEILVADMLMRLDQADTFHFRIGYTEMASEGSVILLAVGDYAADNKEWSASWVLEGDSGSIEYDLWVQGTEHYLRQGNRWVGPEEVIDPDEVYIVFYPMDCRSLPFFGWQFLGPETVFTADGTSDEVEGVSCHIYTASVSTSSEELRAEACVTDAGLPLQLAISGVLDGEVVIISLTDYVAIHEPVTLP